MIGTANAAPQAAENAVFIGKGESAQAIDLRYANRHGLIAGATGTGKTVTLQVLAEGFSRAGVPVFVADVKGDLAGLSQMGAGNPKIQERMNALGMTSLPFAASPVMFWDVFGKKGHPLRTTVSEMGPLLLTRLLGLSEAQAGVLHIAFALADDEGMLLLDLKDLRAMLNHIADHAQALSQQYGLVNKASVAAIQRELLTLESQGAEQFFGEPALDIRDLMRIDRRGKGYINILSAESLLQSPALYSTFLLWLLSELFETLPEKGDMDKPELVFFFDEAHLLFDEAPKALLDKVEQVVRLIRSKGVGIYFVTQNPQDIPEMVLGQLGNRIQHALRAFTPKDQRAIKAAAENFRANPKLDTQEALTQMAVGEALVSLLGDKAVPGMVERCLICPPASRIGTITEAERAAVEEESPVRGLYDKAVDRESAFEMLARRAEARTEAAPSAPKSPAPRPVGRPPQTLGEQVMKTVVRTATNQAARRITSALVRGILGSMRR